MRGVLCGAWTAGAGGRLDGFEVGVGEDAELSGGGRAGGEGDRAGDSVVAVVDAQVAQLAGGEQVLVPHVFGVWLRWAVVRPTTEPVSG